MSPMFFVFLCMLGVFSLLTLAAAGRLLWRRIRLAGSPAHPIPELGQDSRFSDVLLLLGAAMAWYSVASGWICQLTIYPIYTDLSAFGQQAFHGFSRGYLSRLPTIILPLGVLCLAWALLLWVPCRKVSQGIVWAIVCLCLAIVAITPIAAGAQDQMFDTGFSRDLYNRLMWSNGIRVLLITIIGLLSLAAMRRRWRFATKANHVSEHP